VFVTQLSSNAGISVRRTVWDKTNCSFMNNNSMQKASLEVTIQEIVPNVCMSVVLNILVSSVMFSFLIRGIPSCYRLFQRSVS
jgi:hypothetical protein